MRGKDREKSARFKSQKSPRPGSDSPLTVYKFKFARRGLAHRHPQATFSPFALAARPLTTKRQRFIFGGVNLNIPLLGPTDSKSFCL